MFWGSLAGEGEIGGTRFRSSEELRPSHAAKMGGQRYQGGIDLKGWWTCYDQLGRQVGRAWRMCGAELELPMRPTCFTALSLQGFEKPALGGGGPLLDS